MQTAQINNLIQGKDASEKKVADLTAQVAAKDRTIIDLRMQLTDLEQKLTPSTPAPAQDQKCPANSSCSPELKPETKP